MCDVMLMLEGGMRVCVMLEGETRMHDVGRKNESA